MKTAQEIYEEYNIIPNLQLHQLRVAAVGSIVCENLTQPVNTHDVVLACLFHDMGNIIKFDLSVFPEFREPKGIEYWEGIKKDFVRRYGDVAHDANVAIAREIGLSEAVIRLIDGVTFSNMEATAESDSMEQKIAEYGDCRVGPHGILPLATRLGEARERYLKRGKTYYSEEGFKKLSAAAEELERQIMAKCRIVPEDINDSSAAPFVETLRTYDVS